MTQIKLVYNHLPQLAADMRRRVAQVVRETASQVKREAKLSMTGPKHGRAYRGKGITVGAKGKRGKGLIAAGARATGGRVVVGYGFHRASAPGEAPAVDTGNLMNSISTGMIGPTMAEVRASAGYAEILERRKNRPFLEPAAERVRSWFISRIAAVLGGMK